jgi:hypothetical protein
MTVNAPSVSCLYQIANHAAGTTFRPDNVTGLNASLIRRQS